MKEHGLQLLPVYLLRFRPVVLKHLVHIVALFGHVCGDVRRERIEPRCYHTVFLLLLFNRQRQLLLLEFHCLRLLGQYLIHFCASLFLQLHVEHRLSLQSLALRGDVL